jgi:alpha-L-rhamnosidase
MTLYGELVSEWRLEDGRFDYRVVVPPNTTATVHLPDIDSRAITLNGEAVSGAVHEFEAGEYRFRMG